MAIRRSGWFRTERVIDAGARGDAEELVDLVARSASGDQLAFAELYRRTYDRIHRSVVRLVRAADHAAEVTQEVYVEVWSQSTRFDPRRGSVLGWMGTIARRRSIDRIRTVSRTWTRDLAYGSACHVPELDEVWEGVEQRFDRASLRTALARLSPVQREALLLAYVAPTPRTHVQIAEFLDLPLGTVKARIRDGLIKLRANLTT